MPTICWYLPLRESMSVTTVDTLCQRRRCIELSQFVIWFAQFFKGRLDIPYDNFQCYQRIVSYHTCTCLWTYLLYTSVSCLPMSYLDVFSTAQLDRTGQLDRLRERVGRSGARRLLGPCRIYRWRWCGYVQAPPIRGIEAWTHLNDGHHGLLDCSSWDFIRGFCTFSRCDGDCWCEVDIISIRWFF